MGFNIQEIPPELKAIPNWVCWRAVPDPKSHSGMSKRPVNPRTGGNAQANNPETWADFPTACSAAQSRGLAGIGFMFSNTPFFGVDIDDRPLDAPEVQEMLHNIPSYAELSQSGNGVHILCSGKLPGESFNNRTAGIEMYENGRFFVVTGNRISDQQHITDCTEHVKPYYERYTTKKQKQTQKPKPQQAAPAPGHLDKDTVLKKALESKQGSRFGALLSGDISGYNSQSEADIAFCNMLAFWTGRNAELMDAIYRESGLMRDKWDRRQNGSTYGAITIAKACDECQSAYGERRGILPGDAFGPSSSPSRPAQTGAEQGTGGADPAEPQTVGADQSADAAALIVPEGAAPNREKPLPPYFYYDTRDNLRVDPAKLWQHVRKRECYFWVGNGSTDGARRYFYDPRRGVYDFMGDSRIKGKIQEYIAREEPDAVKTKDVNEVFNLLTNEDCFKPDSFLDSSENLINFQNGFFDLCTWSMYPHQNSVISTVQLPLAFDPSKEYTLDDAPTFKHYLHDLTEGDPQKQQLLLEYMGAVLSNIPGHRFKQSLFLVGAGNTGKSKYIELLCNLTGEQSCASVSFSDLGERFQSGAIYGKRLVCDADMKVQRAKDNGLFMKITGGDPVQIEFKGMNTFTTVHRGYLLFASNALPRWGGNTTDAAYDRMLVIECNNVIPPERQDPHLNRKLFNERQAIVYIALRALLGAVQRGYRFTRPDTLALTVKQLKRNNCPSIDFFESCCIEYENADHSIQHCMLRSKMHDAFVKWCKTNAPSAYIPGAREFYKDILQYKNMPDGSLTRIYNGGRYYTFTLTAEAKSELCVFDSIE